LKARTMTAVITAAAVAAGGLAASQMASARPAAGTLSISADRSGKLKFNKSSLKTSHGKITIKMSNPSSLPHSVAIKGKGKGKVVRKGGTSTVTATLKKGRYTYYCTVSGHEAAGMKGTLTVS
jgi:plastocyanin